MKPKDKKEKCKHKWQLFPFNGQIIGKDQVSIKAVCEKCLQKEYL